MTTPRDIIKRSMRMLGVIASGETPTGNEANDAMQVFNAYIGILNNKKGAIFYVKRVLFTLLPQQQAFTIGAGQDLDIARPQKIERASIITNFPNTPLERPMAILTFDQWQQIAVKNVGTSIPAWLYYDHNYPVGTVYLWPYPNVETTLCLYLWQQLAEMALDDEISLPPGYEDMFAWNLALRLAPEYERTPSDVIVQQAAYTYEQIFALNSQPQWTYTDAALRPIAYTWNYLTGDTV